MKNPILKYLVVTIVLSGFCTLDLLAQSDSPQADRARADSLARDSVARVIASEEVATLVPSYYATLIIEINASIIPHINGANGIVNDPKIYELQQDFYELSRLTDYVILRNNILEGIESLEKQWKNNLDHIQAYTENLKSRTTDLVEMKRDLAEERNQWLSRRSKLVYGQPIQQVLDYVLQSIDTIDYFLAQSASTLDTVTITYTRLTELQIRTQGYVEELGKLRIDRMTTMLTTRGDFIWKVRFQSHMESYRSQT